MVVNMPESEFLALCQKHLRLYVSLDDAKEDGKLTGLKVKIRLDFEKEDGGVEEVCSDTITTSGWY